MFCPGRNMRNSDKGGSCGADLSSTSTGAPGSQVTAQAPASGASTPSRPTTATHRRVGRVIAGVIAVVIVVAAGLNTSWFGLAGPHLVPGNYTLSGSSASNTIVASVTQGNHVNLEYEGHSWVGDAQVSRVGKDHLHVRVPIAEEGGQLSGCMLNLVIPQGVPGSVIGTWAMWFTDENGFPNLGGIAWAVIEDGDTLKGGVVSSSDAPAAARSLGMGTFQGDSGAKPGSWARQDDGSFALTFPDSDGALTFRYHR